MMLPFLGYINNLAHKWHVCFGVLYATHLWQVGDASSLNGVFKAELPGLNKTASSITASQSLNRPI